ncbi:hypothetical protein A8709_21325 [Paenibacillus pectinilyticus]|uniref:ABC transporter substrate-binding protein n=1 Tax=Paenibacillus pectinilyticus TaxID=512399 RepID=A0A1C0ZXM2_9BACL|nr:extracellular solute-binding protein [Paenibacillus pectinilyticus]OCT12876.1 hypothetical protein A8709_21325 [Paenibacillus pectinilyticus]
MRKISLLALACTCTTVLAAGCGTTASTSPTPASTTSAAPAASASAPAATTAAAKPVTLKYLTWDYADRTKSTDAWIKDMKEKYNITIEMQNVPTDQYESSFKTKLAANDLPDLVAVHGVDKGLVAEKAHIDAKQFLDLSDLKSVSEYLPAVIKDRKDNKANKLFYVPVSTNVLGVTYNKKLFKDNGLTVPTNIDDFVAAVEKLKAANVTPIAGSFKDAWTTQIVNFIAFGQYVNSKDMNTRVKLADGSLKYGDIKQDVSKALNVQLDWLSKGYFTKDYLGTDVNVASAMVGTGKTAMLINGTWQYKSVQDADPKAEIGFFALPLNAKGEKTAVPTSADSGIMINADSKNVEAAKIALNAYLSADNQTRVIADLNGISTNTKVKSDNAYIAEVVGAMSSGDVQPDWWGGNSNYQPSGSTFVYDKEMQNLVAKGKTVDQFISDFDKANDKALEKK